jgi:hypothetical protein
MLKTLILLVCALSVAPAQNAAPSGQMKVDGKTVKFTHVYAFATEGFFDKKKDDTVVILADRALTDAQMRDESGLRRMATDGKLNCVRATINTSGQIVNFLVGHPAFKAIPSGGSTEHVFEGTLDSHNVAGKVHTKGEQQFFGTKYDYDASFKATVQARK